MKIQLKKDVVLVLQITALKLMKNNFNHSQSNRPKSTNQRYIPLPANRFFLSIAYCVLVYGVS